MINLDKLRQAVNEDIQSKKGVREYIQKDLENSLTTGLKAIFDNMVTSIQGWIDEETKYDSQHLVRYKLSLIPITEVVVEIMLAVVRNPKPVAIQAIVDSIARRLDYDEHLLGIKTAGELIGVCVNSGLYNAHMPGHTGEYIMIESLVKVDKQTQVYLDRIKYVNPMVCEPADWTNNHNGGYLTIKDSVLLGNKENHHTQRQALDALNVIQQIPWELDEYILTFLEEPNKPPETIEAKQAHDLLALGSEQVYDEMLDAGNEFYFQWRYDTRGRMYSQGYYVNLQSTGYKKASLNFSKKQLITGEV